MKYLAYILPLFFLLAFTPAFHNTETKSNTVRVDSFPMPYQNLGNAAAAVNNPGGMFIRKMLSIPTFYDTTSANTTFAKDYASSVIFTTSDNTQWIRNSTKSGWISQGGTSIFVDGVDSLTADTASNSICWWKMGASTCYPLNSDSSHIINNQFCYFNNGDSTCFTVTGDVINTGIDTLYTSGNNLCYVKLGVTTCFPLTTPVVQYWGPANGGLDIYNLNTRSVGIGGVPSGAYRLDVKGDVATNSDLYFTSTAPNIYFDPPLTTTNGLTINPAHEINTANSNYKSLVVFTNAASINYQTGTNTFSLLEFNPNITTDGGTNTIRGIYFNPLITTTTGTTLYGIDIARGISRFRDSVQVDYLANNATMDSIITTTPQGKLKLRAAPITIVDTIHAGYGIVATPDPITETGTITADTSTLYTDIRNQFDEILAADTVFTIWPVRTLDSSNGKTYIYLANGFVDSVYNGGSGWSLTGNAGTTAGTNFIGTTDGEDFVIKTDNNEVGRFTTTFGIQAGENTLATAAKSAAFNSGTTASGENSFAANTSTTASGESSFAVGDNSLASGDISFVAGSQTEARGNSSGAFGVGTKAKAVNGFVIGSDNDTTDTPDPNVEDPTDRVFQIGIGGQTNAMTVLRNGNVGIGTAAPEGKLHVDGGGNTDIILKNAEEIIIEANEDLELKAGIDSNGSYIYLYNTDSLVAWSSWNDAASAIVMKDNNLRLWSEYRNQAMSAWMSMENGSIQIYTDGNSSNSSFISMATNELHLSSSSNINKTSIDLNNDQWLINSEFGGISQLDATNININYNVGILNPAPTEALDIIGNQKIEGNIYPATDSAYNIGDSLFRFNNGWFAGTVHTGGNSLIVGNAHITDSGWAVGKVAVISPTGKTVWKDPASNITGITDGSAATAGNIGEVITGLVSSYTNYTTTATYQNISSITLSAGSWDISAGSTFNSNSSTITTSANAIFVISTTTASAAGAIEGTNMMYIPQAALLGTSKASVSIPPYNVNITTPTTYYLNTQAAFTLGNPQYVGKIRAVRIR